MLISRISLLLVIVVTAFPAYAEQYRVFGKGIVNGDRSLQIACVQVVDTLKDDRCTKVRFLETTPQGQTLIGRGFLLDSIQDFNEQIRELYYQAIPNVTIMTSTKKLYWTLGSLGLGVFGGGMATMALASKHENYKAQLFAGLGIALIGAIAVIVDIHHVNQAGKIKGGFEEVSNKKFKAFFLKNNDSWQFRPLKVSEKTFDQTAFAIDFNRMEVFGLILRFSGYDRNHPYNETYLENDAKVNCGDQVGESLDKMIVASATYEQDRTNTIAALELKTRIHTLYENILAIGGQGTCLVNKSLVFKGGEFQYRIRAMYPELQLAF